MATPRKKEYVLDENQKQLILDNFSRGVTDVNLLTKLVTGNDKKDGRDIEGVSVRKFLVESKLNYKTKHNAVREDAVSLTDENKEVIRQGMTNNKTTIALAREIFGQGVNNLSREWRAVLAFMREENPDYRPDAPNDAGKYYAPKETDRVVKKINEAVGIELDPSKISGKYKQYVDKLRVNLNSMRFVRICDAYTVQKDRDLFEQQFILMTWDKPDLTADELNLYMSVCKDIVNGEVLTSHIYSMNRVFDAMEEDGENTFSVKFAETLKAKTDEYMQNQKRVSDTIKKLQGDRSDRLKNQSRDETTFVSIVQMAQEETERKNLLRLAELQRAAISKEAARLESLDELMCRILGVSKEEVI